MTLNPGNNPFAMFLGLDGRPLNQGTVYIGIANMDPETNPQDVFWDENGGMPALQPLDTISGYVWRAGSPARFWTEFNAFSIRVLDRQGEEVFYSANVAFEIPDGYITAAKLSDDNDDLLAITTKLRTEQTGSGAVMRSVKDKINERYTPQDDGAVANGSTNDAAAIAAALTDATSRELYFPGATYISGAVNAVPAKTTVKGDGAGTILKTNTANHHQLTSSVAGAVIRDIALEGTSSADNGTAGIVFGAGASQGLVENVDLSGMSAYGVQLTGGATDIRLHGLTVHGMTNAYQNSSDVNLYQNAQRSVVTFNYLKGGTGTEVGVLQQINSKEHKVVGNYIDAHTTYGAIDYDPTPVFTYNLFAFNTIKDIDGATLSGNSGAGYYSASTGGQIVAFNHIRNTNINTSGSSLVPGAIGVNAPYGPLAIVGNMINQAQWYGTMLTASTVAVEIEGNNYVECVKGAIYLNQSSHTNIVGGTITQLTTTPLTVPGISVNPTGTGPFRGVTACAVRIRGTGFRAAEFVNTDDLVINALNITEAAGVGIVVADNDATAVTGNIVQSTGTALVLSNAQRCMVSGNVFKSGSATVISTTGTCTGSVIDKTCGVDANNISNAGTGCLVETYGTAAPTLLPHQRGDIVWNSAPAVGQPKGWVCTASGTPGTWTSMGNL